MRRVGLPGVLLCLLILVVGIPVMPLPGSVTSILSQASQTWRQAVTPEVRETLKAAEPMALATGSPRNSIHKLAGYESDAVPSELDAGSIDQNGLRSLSDDRKSPEASDYSSRVVVTSNRSDASPSVRLLADSTLLTRRVVNELDEGKTPEASANGSGVQRNSPEASAYGSGDGVTKSEPMALATGSPRNSIRKLTSYDSISLNPNGNVQLVLRLTALGLLLFCVASVARPESMLRELAWVAMIMGSVLALVALLQKVSPSHNLIFWYFDSKGSEYGPFLNKNHYPFFANLAIGLTMGLIFERWTSRGLNWGMLFHDSTMMWMIAAVSLQLTSLIMALSRGGFSALIAASVLCLAIRLKKVPGVSSALAFAFLGSIVVALMAWAGFDFLASRLTTLSQAETYQADGRWYLWRVAAMVFQDFPLFGSGGETFRHWQTIIQFGGSWNSAETFAHRADNEYLDMFCEHGLFAGILLLSFVFVVVSSLLPRARQNGLIAGALISILSVVLHSVVDFGLRVPAMAVFAIVITGLAYATRSSAHDLGTEKTFNDRYGKLNKQFLPVINLVVVICVLFFLFIFLQTKQRYAVADNYQLAAYNSVKNRDFVSLRSELESMVEATPEDELAHLEYARLALLASSMTADNESNEFKDKMIVHCVQARDLCPLIWESPFWIAQNVDRLDNADSIPYLKIAHRLHPSNATISYTLGDRLAEGNDIDAAIDAWRDSMLYSPRFLKEIMARSLKHITPIEFLDRILPENASVVVQAFKQMVDSKNRDISLDETKIAEVKTTYLMKGAKLIEEELGRAKYEKRPPLLAQAAEIQDLLGDKARAVEFQRSAIIEAPSQIGLRLQMFEYLVALGRLSDAKIELNVIQSLNAGNTNQVESMRKRLFDLEHPRIQTTPTRK